MLENLDWSIFDLLEDVDDMWLMLYNAIKFEVDKMWPIVRSKINITKPVWFSQELYEISKERDRLFNDFRKSNRKNIEYFEIAIKKANKSLNYLRCKRGLFPEFAGN